MIKELSTYFSTELIPLSEKLKLIQVDNGAIELKQHVYATELLEAIKDKLKFICERLNTIDLYHAQCIDIDNWLQKGLDTPPYFDATKRTYKPMLNRAISFFWGPTIMANAGIKRGHFFEGFLVLRDEPEECKSLYKRFPHPKNICQSCHLLVGTSGFSEGNCLVFFPENIKSNHKDEIQMYAVFFFNKFHSIYNKITVPSVKSLVASPQLHSSQLNKRDVYVARCIWGYLHDYFHHCGAKPFDENVYLKTRWAVGVLEEIKVDMQTLKVCLEQDIPFSKEISEFILYERIVRYPQEADYSNNFDSATGFTLLSWFERYSAVKVLTNTIEIDWEQLLKVIPSIVKTIEDIESASTDEKIIAKANSFLFGNYLERPKGRFSPAKNINVAPLTQYFGKSGECMNMVDLLHIERMWSSQVMFNKELSIWLNGQFLPVDEAKVSVLTHALHYGTSVFEGVRCYNKQIFKAAEHAKRLLYSAEVVGLSLNYSVSQLVETMEHLIGLNGLSNGYIRPIAWLGDESLGIYAPDNKTHIAIAAWEWPSVFDQNVVELGVKLVTSPYRRPPAIAAPYKAKAAGVYLNGAISRQLAAKEGADDALMLNCEGNIAEATGANIFFCQGKQLITPIADCFLSGITRETVIELAKQNQYEVIERKIAYEEIKQFDGCFLTGTAYEVQLVRAIDSTNFNNNELATSMRQLYLKTVQV